VKADPHLWGRGDRRRITSAKFPPAVLALVELRDGPGCVECSRLGVAPPQDEPLEVDHKQPLARGGDNRWENLQILCRWHNRAKCAGTLAALERQGKRPPWAP